MGNELATARLGRELALLEALQQVVSEASDDADIIWDEDDKSDLFDVSDEGQTVSRRVDINLTTDGIRAKIGYSSGVHVWEITWPRNQRGPFASVGIATAESSLQYLGQTDLIGGNDESVGWNLSRKVALYNDCVMSEYPENKPDSFVIPDKIVVVLDMNNGVLRFRVDNEDLGICASGLRTKRTKWYPAVSTDTNTIIRIRKIQIQSEPARAVSPPQKTANILKFHECCGENVVLSNDNCTARRKNPSQGNAVVISSRPLCQGDSFYIRVDEIQDNQRGSLKIGIINVIAGITKIPASTTSSSDCYIWSGNDVISGGEFLGSLSENLNQVQVGSVVGIQLEENGELKFYLENRLVGKIKPKRAGKSYGIVDICGKTAKVSKTESPRAVHSRARPHESPRTTVTARERADEILGLMKRTIHAMNNPDFDTGRLVEALYGQFSGLRDVKQKQVFGDKFTELHGVKAIGNLYGYVRKSDHKDKVICHLDMILLNLCLSMSNCSMKFCEDMGRCGILEAICNCLQGLKTNYKANTDLVRKVETSLAVLGNCSRSLSVKDIYHTKVVHDTLVEFCTKTHDMHIRFYAIHALSYVDNPVRDTEPEILQKVVSMLKVCTENSDHNYVAEESTISASGKELLEFIANVGSSKKNRDCLVDCDVCSTIVWFLKRGDNGERERAANCIWVLTDDKTRWKINKTSDLVGSLTLLKDTDNEALNQASDRALQKLLTQGFGQGISKAANPTCNTRQLALRLRQFLELDDVYFNAAFDRCYCTMCHGDRGDKLYYSRGVPSQDYGLPIGWFRFGLQVPPRANAKDVDAFNKWHRSFHGTKKETLSPVLQTGELLQPGDVAMGGTKLGEREGHFDDKRKPKGFDTKQVFLSPSIRYSGHNAYATPFKFSDESAGKVYVAKVAFQVFIRPGSYEIGEQTVGATEQIDPRFDNQELEWSTKERGSTILYGLLVKLEDSPLK